MTIMTYYRNVKKNSSFVTPIPQTDNSGLDSIVENMLEEFDESTIQQKNLYKQQLKKWIRKMKKRKTMKNKAQVRVTIYEMY